MVEPGSELVLVAPAADGSLGNDLYTVSGIFRTGLSGLDASYVLVRLEDGQRLLALDPGRVHEIVVRASAAWEAANVAEALAELAEPEVPLAAIPWTEFRAELREYAQLAESGNVIILVIVFGMAVFGVANTMLMATAERRREFAVVRALGTRPANVAGTVLREGIVLGALSLGVGLLVALPLSFWWAAHPPNLAQWFGDFTMAGSLVEPILRVKVTTTGPLLSGGALLLTALLASVYPAFRSGRVPPADALADR
jgi:ABC-type lipoprotein release transport system permease subunit